MVLFYWTKGVREMTLPHLLKRVLAVCANSWKPTIAAIFGVVVGICLSVILTCGQVLRLAILGEARGDDPVTLAIAQATRYAVMVSLGLLAIVIVLEVLRLAMEKFRTASEREHAKQRKFRTQPYDVAQALDAAPPAAIIPMDRERAGENDASRRRPA